MFIKIRNYFNKKKLSNPKYKYLFDEYHGDEYVCFDCETTGLNPKIDDIISIGAVIIRDNKILASKKFNKFVKPKTKLQIDSIKIHQIREIDLKNAEQIDDVIYEFLDFIENRKLVGYYLEFDVAMINKYVKKKLGITLPNEQIEVSAMYYDKVIKSTPNGNVDLRFDIIADKLDIPLMSKHDAINDAIMTAMMFLKLK